MTQTIHSVRQYSYLEELKLKISQILKTAAFVIAAGVSAPAFAGVVVAEDGESKLKIGAKFFLNATDYHVEDEAKAPTTTRTRGTSVDRAYFEARYYFDDKWMMRFTSDVNVEAATKGSNVFLKYAYVEGKLAGKAAVIRLGLSHTPWIDYEQGLWKHRYVSKVATDHYKYDTSSDLGIGLKGKLMGNTVAYWVTATNGNGYGSTTNNKTASTGLDYNARLGFYPVKGLTLDAQYKYGLNGTRTSTSPGELSTLMQFMASYGGSNYRAGANYIHNHKKNVNTTTKTKDRVIALWAWAKLGGGVGAFARYERVKDLHTAKVAMLDKTHYVAGVEYSPRKNVTFSLAFDQQKDDSSVINKDKTTTRYGLYSQVKF